MKRKSRASLRRNIRNKQMPKREDKEQFDDSYLDDNDSDSGSDHHGLTMKMGPEDDELSPVEVLPSSDDEEESDESGDKDEQEDEWENDQADIEDDKDDSDDEKKDEDEVNLEAWGRKKSMYYNADFIDEDRGRSYREEDNEASKAEEQDALSIQKSFMETIHSSAYDTTPFSIKETVPKEPVEVTTLNWSAITKEQKRQILARRNPEFLPILHEFEEKMIELKELLAIVDKASEIKEHVPNFDYLKLRSQFLLHYCANISFYMTLKSSGETVTNHPVLKTIQEYKELLNKLDKMDPRLKNETISTEDSNINIKKRKISKIDTSRNDGKSGLSANTKSSKKRVRFEDDTGKNEQFIENSSADNEDINDALGGSEQEGEESVSKRSITYQIAKNKGLIKKRSKEYRNPRVRNRNKFRKAEIRRKGQVRKPRTETTRYGGEHAGIHAYVSRSVKLK